MEKLREAIESNSLCKKKTYSSNYTWSERLNINLKEREFVPFLITVLS